MVNLVSSGRYDWATLSPYINSYINYGESDIGLNLTLSLIKPIYTMYGDSRGPPRGRVREELKLGLIRKPDRVGLTIYSTLQFIEKYCIEVFSLIKFIEEWKTFVSAPLKIEESMNLTTNAMIKLPYVVGMQTYGAVQFAEEFSGKVEGETGMFVTMLDKEKHALDSLSLHNRIKELEEVIQLQNKKNELTEKLTKLNIGIDKQIEAIEETKNKRLIEEAKKKRKKLKRLLELLEML